MEYIAYLDEWNRTHSEESNAFEWNYLKHTQQLALIKIDCNKNDCA